MDLKYVGIKMNLQVVKTEIDELLNYIESNQEREDSGFIDIESYSRLAEISTHVLQSDCKTLKE
ncbi:hypothetical protein [Stanieria cyanosphaera]|uniref:hypothetical protein n=1 Tax=Stanieria cyanosphaera TaxID=102116 RepID=UPI0005A19604|nr:hypothetical protein [Stanieria cyanosphaera]